VEDLLGADDKSSKPQYSNLTSCLSRNPDPLLLSCHPLNQRDIVFEPSIIDFLGERARMNSQFTDQLHAIINLSKTDQTVSQAAVNAITILVQAGVQFNSADLRRIRIAGADLSGGHFDYAQFQDADLTGVNLSRTWLCLAGFSNACMNGVEFGETASWDFPGTCSMAISPNKNFAAMGFANGEIKVLDAKS
jgi:hypothetical protein